MFHFAALRCTTLAENNNLIQIPINNKIMKYSIEVNIEERHSYTKDVTPLKTKILLGLGGCLGLTLMMSAELLINIAYGL